MRTIQNQETEKLANICVEALEYLLDLVDYNCFPSLLFGEERKLGHDILVSLSDISSGVSIIKLKGGPQINFGYPRSPFMR